VPAPALPAAQRSCSAGAGQAGQASSSRGSSLPVFWDSSWQARAARQQWQAALQLRAVLRSLAHRCMQQWWHQQHQQQGSPAAAVAAATHQQQQEQQQRQHSAAQQLAPPPRLMPALQRLLPLLLPPLPVLSPHQSLPHQPPSLPHSRRQLAVLLMPPRAPLPRPAGLRAPLHFSSCHPAAVLTFLQAIALALAAALLTHQPAGQ
jgi:hypothetical protein